jgi:hypothetical protein
MFKVQKFHLEYLQICGRFFRPQVEDRKVEEEKHRMRLQNRESIC